MRCFLWIPTRWMAGAALLLLDPSGDVWAQQNQRYKLESERWENFSTGGLVLPHLSGGAILVVKDNPSAAPVLVRIGDNGVLERLPLTFPGAHRLTIRGVSASPDGTVAAAAIAWLADATQGNFLIRIEPDRARQEVIPVAGYSPMLVVLPSDGTIWTIGNLQDDSMNWTSHLLKRFSAEGKELGSKPVKTREALSYSNPARAGEIRDPKAFSALRASKDRVGWMTAGNEYIEFDLDGAEILRLDGPEGALTSGTLALSAESDVLVEIGTKKEASCWSLDRKQRRWNRVNLEEEGMNPSLLLGFEGRRIIMTKPDGRVRRFRGSSDAQ